MQERKARFMLFSIGAVGYGLIEIIWRGYTHWSMLGAGGICFMFFGGISEKFKKTGIFIKGLIGSTFITAAEFVFGVIFNIILKKNVWDYSKMPMNIIGQICMPYSCLWVLLSLVGIPFAGKIKSKLTAKYK